MNRDERRAALEQRRDPLPERRERLWAKDAFREFDVYRIPTELLILNPTNRRFRAERQYVEEQLGRALDAENSADDEISIVSLLLDTDNRVDGDQVIGSPNKDTTALVDDWLRRRQERPLWIREDGVVRNGNRRLAMLKRLQGDRGREGFDWVDVIFLPTEEFDEEDLFDMEAREQLTEGLKVRYTDLNLLLTLRDGAEREGVDWNDPESVETTAHRIQHLVGNNPDYAATQLWAIKYMDDYLEFKGRAEHYHLLRGQVERFRDVGRNMVWVRREDPSREPEMLELCFAAVDASFGHMDVREIRRLLQDDPDRFQEMLVEVREILDEAEPIGAAGVVDEVPVDAEAPDEEAAADPPLDRELASTVPAVKRAIDVRLQSSRDARSVRDVSADVRTAADRLRRIDVADLAPLLDGRQGDRLRDAVATVVAWADEARRVVGESPGTGSAE